MIREFLRSHYRASQATPSPALGICSAKVAIQSLQTVSGSSVSRCREFDKPLCNADNSYDRSLGGYVASAAGFPEGTVPVGHHSQRLPIGISFLGLPYGEQRILDLGRIIGAGVAHQGCAYRSFIVAGKAFDPVSGTRYRARLPRIVGIWIAEFWY
jgi:hypothetical protein